MRRVLTSDLGRLSERDRRGLALTYLVGSSVFGVMVGALILAGLVPWPTWLGLCGLVGGAINARGVLMLARKRC